jgi:PilZ domain
MIVQVFLLGGRLAVDGNPQNSGGPLVRVWGMDANGRAFFQNVYAQQLTKDGALLAALECALKVDDVIGIQLGDKKARFRVVRTSAAALPQRINAEVEVLQGQECPWKDALPTATSAPAAPSGRDKRKFLRHKIRFPLELHGERAASTHMQTNATDISGRGCYVEMMMPLPLGTPVQITFWLDSDKIITNGVVRASDPGVGMGIEFTGLEISNQERFQKHLDKLDDSRLGPKE